MSGRPISALAQRLVNKVDFERLLATRPVGRSAHFAVHHVRGAPAPPPRPSSSAMKPELSTTPALECDLPVDDSLRGHWLGCVVPKRHARRAVTRNQLRRQARSVFEGLATELPAGLWLISLRSPFDRAIFVSARSAALAAAARTELEALLRRVKV